MSEMPGALDKQRRLEVIKQCLFEGRTQAEMARTCGVSERTITRDLKTWRDNGGFEEWLLNKFMALYGKIEIENPVVAFREVSLLLGKTMRQKLDADMSIKGQITIKGWGLNSGRDRDSSQDADAREGDRAQV